MSDNLLRMLHLYEQGLNCSQILISLGLEDIGKSNPDLIQAVGGLGGGIGFSGKTCGALTGGACLLNLYAGEKEHTNQDSDKGVALVMVNELVAWFGQEIGQTYSGTNCEDIVGAALENNTAPLGCAQIVMDTYIKIQEIAANRS